MRGLWVAPSTPPEARLKFRVFYKVKRAIIETFNVDPQSIVVDKPKRKLWRVVNGNLVEICLYRRIRPFAA